MRAKSRILSIAVSVLMIFSMLVCGIDQTAFAAQNEENAAAAEEPGTGDSEQAEKSFGTKRTILLYDCGSDLETEAGLASYNVRQILESSFSSDDDIKFIIMTGGSHKWQLEKEYLVFPDDVNLPDDAVIEYDSSDPEGSEVLDNESQVSNNYNQIWEAKGIDAAENPGKMVLLDGDGITGEDGEAVKSKDELMSVSDTLRAFINYGVENFPADKYDLILWDHGGGPAGGFGADEHADDSDDWTAPDIMSFEGLADAFSYNKVTDSDGDGELDGKFDFINFDACLMNSVELALVMADYTDFYIASVESEPGYGQYYGPKASADGQQYTGWLDVLGENPDYDTFDLGKIIVDDFYKFYEKESGDGYSQDGTLAVIDTKKMMNSQFLNVLTALVRVLRDEAANPEEDGIHFYDELKSYANAIEYSGYELFDLGQVAALLSVVNSEVSEKDWDREEDYYINCNNYFGISKDLVKLMDSDSDNAFMYARGTSGIRSKDNYYRTIDDSLGFGPMETSGMSIYFPGLELTASALDYFKAIDPVFDKMPARDKRKEFIQDYEEAVSYYSLILYTGKVVDRLINDQSDDIEITDKSDVDYEMFMEFAQDELTGLWDELVIPELKKIQRTEDVDEHALDGWFKALVSQIVEDAVEGDKVTVEKLDGDERGSLKVTVNGARKHSVNSVERNIYAELPELDNYLASIDSTDRQAVVTYGNLSLGSVQGKLNTPPEGASIAETIKWYSESGGVWDIDAMEQKWYGINDAENGIHVASIYKVDEDGYYVPALRGTSEDGPDEERMVLLEFSNKNTDGNTHALTSVWFIDPEAGPVMVELKELKNEITLMPILWIRPIIGRDYFAPISKSPFTVSAGNAENISLDFIDVNDIGDIKDTDGDGKTFDSKITITDIFGYKIEVDDRTHIKYARVRPGIYTGEELIPELVYRGETLKEINDYVLNPGYTFDPETMEPIPVKLIEPGDYEVNLIGKGMFKGQIYATFSIVLPEEEAAKAVENAKEALAEAQEAIDALDEESSSADVIAAMQQLSAAQQQLADAQEALLRTRDILSKEKQAQLEDEIAKLEQQVEDLNNEVAELQVVDISNYAMSLEKSSYAYTGKAIEPAVKVSGLSADDYTVEYANNIKVGTATVTVKAKGDKFKGEITKTFKITKRANTLAAKGKTATVRSRKLKKKSQKLKVSKVIRLTNKGKGKLTYAKASGNKKITINSSTGKVTVKKGLKKGTYKVKVNVTAAGDATTDKITRTVLFRIKVK